MSSGEMVFLRKCHVIALNGIQAYEPNWERFTNLKTNVDPKKLKDQMKNITKFKD